jgi:hypothetical protein
MDFDWQAQWENGSDEEFERYARMTDEQLIKALKKQELGLYNRIWQVVQKRKCKSFIKPMWICLKSLGSNEAFLERQHCTETLFNLIKLRDLNLKNQLIGSSLEFDDLQFKSALKVLEKKVKAFT